MSKYNKKSKNKLILVPVLGLATLSSAVVLGATPGTHAETKTGTTQVSVTVGSVIAVQAPTNINVGISAPSPSGAFNSASDSVKITTNNFRGYTVYITSNTEETSLKHSESSVNKTVQSIPSQTTLTDGKFASANTWGWSNDGTTYHKIVAKGSENSTGGNDAIFAQSNSAAVSGETKTLHIGATVDSTLPSGTYSGTLLFTAITNGTGEVVPEPN